MSVEDRLKELGIELPPAPPPAANYVPYMQEGSLVFVAGQVPRAADGSLPYRGKVGRELSEDEGYQAARLCALNCLAQVKAALGSLDRVKQVVRIGGFVNSTEEFVNHPEVINGASDVVVEVFGERGRHARAAIGCSALPRGVAVEVEMIVAVS
ncbi:MAG: RidA family protein [SAR324 cluster bacterium]|nr:RidA family protein [SAR324 cluster bacterium]